MFGHNGVSPSPHLTKFHIWLDHNNVCSQDIICLGWICGINTEQDSESALMLKLASLLSPEAMEHIQLNSHTVTHTPDKQIKTQAFLIEIDCTAQNTFQTTIFQKLHPTSEMVLVPMNGGTDKDNHICQFFIDQNQLLHSHVSIQMTICKVHRIRSLNMENTSLSTTP